MVFAAGFGTRMAPLTNDRPKPLLEVGGIPLLDHALAFRKGLSLRRVVVNAHYRAEMIAAHLSDSGVRISVESPDILDTGGGLIAARDALESDIVYTLNPDVIWLGPNPLQVLRDRWQQTDALGLVLLVPLDAAHNRTPPGDFSLSPTGKISRGKQFVYTGAQILDTTRLSEAGTGAFSLNAYWDLLMAEGALEGVIYPGEWCDVGTPEGLDRANALWSARHHG